jgi:hypothetical protein
MAGYLRLYLEDNRMESHRYLRRNTAAEYLQAKYGFGAVSTLAKLACVGGGPTFQKAGRAVLYTAEALDAWAQAQIGAVRRSTSDMGR